MAESQITQAAASLDLSSLSANLVILAAFISTAVAGIWKGLKVVRESVAKADPVPGHKVLAASIIEHVTLQAWSESNTDVAKALREVRDAIYSLRNTDQALCGDISDLRHAITELKHRIELSDHHRGH